MGTVYIIGHKNPDTDSICSAIAYAEFKKRISEDLYIPTRLGAPNNETMFVLDYFRVPLPSLLENVYTQLSDTSRLALAISPSVTIPTKLPSSSINVTVFILFFIIMSQTCEIGAVFATLKDVS